MTTNGAKAYLYGILLLIWADFSVLYLQPTKKPSQLLYSLPVLRNDDKKQLYFLLTDAASVLIEL